MSPVAPVDIPVFPDDCDAYGHVNNAAFVRMFERARWEALRAGPGVDVFQRHGVAPVVRRATVEFHAPAHPGQVLRFDVTLVHLGRTSFSLHQTARRADDGVLVAEADMVFVCLDGQDRPTEVPAAIRQHFGTRPSVRPGMLQHYSVRGLALTADVLGDGPAILFIHGFPLDRTMWRHLAATLTGWRRIAPDLRGAGLSDVPDGGYSMTEYADDLAALLDVLRVESTVVCGLSMGAYVAFALLRRHPGKVRGLVLANTRAEADTPEGLKGRDEMIALVEGGGSEAIVERLMPKLFAPSSLTAMPQVVEHVRTMIANSPPRGVIGALEAMKARDDQTAFLPEINVPTLVIAGREDQLISNDRSKALADAIPEAQFTLIPEAGHLTPMEQPIATGRVIGEFLEAIS